MKLTVDGVEQDVPAVATDHPQVFIAVDPNGRVIAVNVASVPADTEEASPDDN